MNTLAVAYANSLLEIGESENQTEKLYNECINYQTILSQFPAYQSILTSPMVSKKEKKQLLAEWLLSAPVALQNVFYLLCDKVQAHLLPEILESYIEIYQNQNSILPVTVISAVEISENLLQELQQTLQNKMNKTILLHNQINPSCLGGLQLQIKDTQYDSSIQSRLEKVHKLLSEI